MKAQLINVIRQRFWFHPGLRDVRMKQRVEQPKLLKNGDVSKKPSVWYRCAYCQELFKVTAMRYDHIEPVVELTGFRDWNTYIARMFGVIPQGINLCCIPCHADKTGKERAQRTEIRRQRRREERLGQVS